MSNIYRRLQSQRCESELCHGTRTQWDALCLYVQCHISGQLNGSFMKRLAVLSAHKLTKHSLHRHTGITSHSLATGDCTVNVAKLSSPGRLEEFLDYVFPRRTFSLQLTKNTDKCCTSCTRERLPQSATQRTDRYHCSSLSTC